MDRLEIITDRRKEIALVEQCIRAQVREGHPLRILEAGCGQKWDLDLGDIRYEVTGVDLDPAALRLRTEVRKDLHNSIVGDLRTIGLPFGSFDVIYSYYVLEHVPNAELVLVNFLKWLRPGGIAIIKIPDPHSVHGFISRTTPHWFHLLFYRYILGNRQAGKPGFAPYRVYYDPVVSREGMRRFCADYGVQLQVEIGDGCSERATRWVHRLMQIFRQLLGPLSFGVLSSRHSDLLYVIEKS